MFLLWYSWLVASPVDITTNIYIYRKKDKKMCFFCKYNYFFLIWFRDIYWEFQSFTPLFWDYFFPPAIKFAKRFIFKAFFSDFSHSKTPLSDMALILDGNSKHDANVWSWHWKFDLIKAFVYIGSSWQSEISFKKKLFSITRSQCFLSYHLK